MWTDHDGYGMGWHWFEGLGMVFFWFVLALLVMAAVKYLKCGRHPHGSDGKRKSRALVEREGSRSQGKTDREKHLRRHDDLR